MELNFLIFPAPKSSYSSEDLLGELLYIPVPTSPLPTKSSSSSSPSPTTSSPPLSSFSPSSLPPPPSSFHPPSHLSNNFPFPLCHRPHLPSPSPPPSLLIHPSPSSLSSIIPCLLLKPSSPSTHILIYFHGNGEDINQSYDLLSNLRNNLQIFILAMEYPGYGIRPGRPNADKIIENAVAVYDFLIGIGFSHKKIILCGR